MLLNQFNCVTEQATVNKRQDKAFFLLGMQLAILAKIYNISILFIAYWFKHLNVYLSHVSAALSPV